MKVQLFLDRIIYVDLQHPVLKEISRYYQDIISDVLITFCLWHVPF